MIMKVMLYEGSWNLVKKSGVGQALLHQKAMLEAMGIPTTGSWKERAEVIHINTIFPDSLFAIWKARRRGMSVVSYAHSTMEDFKHSFPFSDALAPLFRRWIRFLYQQGDLIVTPTPYSKRILESYGIAKPIHVISNGVDTKRFSPNLQKRQAFRTQLGIGESEKMVIGVGHFIERKGILDFIELAKRLPGVQFFWFGYTPSSLLTQNVKKAFQALPVNIRFPGYIDQEALSQAYCAADLFLFPSHEETEGIVVLEALSSGVPVIVRDIPVYQMWLTDAQEVYKARSMDDFMQLLSSFEAGTLENLTQKGRAVAEQRSIGAIGSILAALYEELGVKVERRSVGDNL